MPAYLIINREYNFQGGEIKFHTYLDNRKIGEIGNNCNIKLSIAPGRHQIYIKIWTGRMSTPIDIDIQEEAELSLYCGIIRGGRLIISKSMAEASAETIENSEIFLPPTSMNNYIRMCILGVAELLLFGLPSILFINLVKLLQDQNIILTILLCLLFIPIGAFVILLLDAILFKGTVLSNCIRLCSMYGLVFAFIVSRNIDSKLYDTSMVVIESIILFLIGISTGWLLGIWYGKNWENKIIMKRGKEVPGQS
jgi:hypothetical protein